jgi:Zn-finger nucleic acid-binding protein
VAKQIKEALASVLNLEQKEILNQIDTQLKQDELPESKRICPECGRSFSLISVKDLTIDCCKFCGSIWFDEGELKSLTGLSRDVPADNLAHRKSRYKCPACESLMREYLYLQRCNLLVDKCPEGCGVYLESGELKRAFLAND